MSRHRFKFINNLKIRWKMTVVVLPLVLVPIIVVGTVVGWIAYQQAYLGITQTSKDDLDHLAAFLLGHGKGAQAGEPDFACRIDHLVTQLAHRGFCLYFLLQFLGSHVSLR